MKMHRTVLMLTVLAVAAPVVSAEYRSFPELLDAMLEAQRQRAEDVTDYAMDVSLMDQPITQFYERAQADAAARSGFEIFRLVPMSEVHSRLQGEAGVSSADLRSLATDAGLPPGMLSKMPGSSGSWDGMVSGDTESINRFKQSAEIVGRESIDGRNAYLARADGLNLVQVADGGKFVIDSISVWVDREALVMLKMRMDGVMQKGGERNEMFIERHDQDHRTVPGSRLLLPYRTTLRMGGMLGPKEQKEMEEARKQLEEFDRQMAAMPEDQKQMMQSMMGGRLEAMRKMITGDGMTIESAVLDVRINQGIASAIPKAATSAGTFSMPVSYANAAPAPQNPDALNAAREECLERKIAEAEAAKESQKKKKRLGKLFGAVGRMAGRHGGGELAADIQSVSTDVYTAGATMQDLEIAADALGITKEDVAECENPQ
jgi:hypothetical protein